MTISGWASHRVPNSGVLESESEPEGPVAPTTGSASRQALGIMASTCRIKYQFVESPLGKIELSGCEAGVHGIKLLEKRIPRPDSSHRLCKTSVSEEGRKDPEEVTPALDKCAAWLEAYFHAPETVDHLPLPAFHHPIFQQDCFRRQVLLKLMTAVKMGDTVSYQQLATLAGRSRAARAVGGAMRDNPVPIIIPCHRVIYSSGQMGNYTGAGVDVKEWLLNHEKPLKRKHATN